MLIIYIIAALLIAGAAAFIFAAARDSSQRQDQVRQILRDIETRDLRMATRWMGR